MNRRFFLSILATCFVVPPAIYAATAPELTEKDLSQFTPIAEGIKSASSLILYEGLPHQMWEAEQLKKEVASKETVLLHDFPFYASPLKVAAEDVEPLRRLSASADSYYSYSGPKRCGGFHPDYCLAWKDGETVYHLLICFGCQEMKLYGPKSELTVDIREPAFKAFEAALKKYQVQGPKRG